LTGFPAPALDSDPGFAGMTNTSEYCVATLAVMLSLALCRKSNPTTTRGEVGEGRIFDIPRFLFAEPNELYELYEPYESF